MSQKWNELLDQGHNTIKNIKEYIKLDEYIRVVKKILLVENCLKFLEKNEYSSQIYKIVRDSSNYKSCRFTFNNSKYVLTYKDRKFYTCLPFILILTGKIWTPAKIYFILSLFICRENFDLRNYKI